MVPENFSWTETRVDELRRLYASGASASEIARDVGAPTRNAVIGKIRRLKLTRSAKSSIAKPRPKAQAALRAGNIARKAMSWHSEAALKVAEEGAREIAALDAKFPAADESGVPYASRSIFQCAMLLPRAPGETIWEQRVCGKAVHPGTSWCPACLKVVAAPPKLAAFKAGIMMRGVTA